MSFYRIYVLDREGVAVDSRAATTLADTASILLTLADSIDEPWAKPLLDADGELTLRVKGAADRELSADEKAGITALLEEFGAFRLATDDEGGRWAIEDTGGRP